MEQFKAAIKDAWPETMAGKVFFFIFAIIITFIVLVMLIARGIMRLAKWIFWLPSRILGGKHE